MQNQIIFFIYIARTGSLFYYEEHKHYVPLDTEPGISLIILPLMRMLRTKFEADYRHIPLHFSHNERTPVQISLQYLH